MAVNVLLAAAFIAAISCRSLALCRPRADRRGGGEQRGACRGHADCCGRAADDPVALALKDAPPSFSIANPARIAIDLAGTGNSVGRNSVEFNQGDLRSVNIVQAQERTRLVLNLRRSVNHSVTVSGNTVQVALADRSKRRRSARRKRPRRHLLPLHRLRQQGRARCGRSTFVVRRG